MNSTDPLNTYFKKIVDSEGESKLLAGLAGLGVHLPQGLRVVVGHIDKDSFDRFDRIGAPILDERNVPITVAPGTRLLHAVAVNRGVDLSGAVNYTFGFSLNPQAAVEHPFLSTAVAPADFQAADPSIVADKHPLVTGVADMYISMSRGTPTALEPADTDVEFLFILV